MKRLWVRRDINAPREVVWELLTDLKYWPEWGPSVRKAKSTMIASEKVRRAR